MSGPSYGLEGSGAGAACAGASPEGGPALHAHIVVGKSDGTAMGGHLLGGHVRPTLEVALTESPAHLQRAIDPETGLALLAG